MISHAFEALWWAYAVLVVMLAWIAYRDSRVGWPGTLDFFRLSHPVYALPVLLILLNGASPYLGLKTETSFAMFSNLRTEGRGTNHLLVTREARLTEHQDDLVTIERSSDAELERLSDHGYRLTWFEFRSYLSRKAQAGDGPISVGYVRRGERRFVADATADPELSQPDQWLARKLLYFRPVPVAESTPCHH